MRVRAKVDCFPADATYRKAGEEFEYNGPKNENLEPVKKGESSNSDSQTSDNE